MVTVVVRRRRERELRRRVPPRRFATYTSSTIGRIIGRRFVRSKKKRDSVSRILVFR
jgi:hypothetical protein